MFVEHPTPGTDSVGELGGTSAVKSTIASVSGEPVAFEPTSGLY